MLNESDLIQGCIKGNKKDQQMLYELYSGKLLAVGLRYCKSRLDAEDILQESFIKIFANIKNFRQDCPLFQWLKRIVVNTALKNNRSKLYTFPPADVAEMANVLPEKEFTLSNYNFKELLGMIQQLPSGCQVIFNLYAIEGYQHNEIAEMLKISEGTSKSQLARAKSLLQKMLVENKELV